MTTPSFFSRLPRTWWAVPLAALPLALAVAVLLHPGPLVQLRVDLVPGPDGGTVMKLAFSTCSCSCAGAPAGRSAPLKKT